VADWIDNQGNLAAKTIKTKLELLAPILAEIGRAAAFSPWAGSMLRCRAGWTGRRAQQSWSCRILIMAPDQAQSRSGYTPEDGGLAVASRR
jgi:hypothetical protein